MPQGGALLDVTPALAPERALLLELLRGLDADQWAQPTECPAWSVQGLALHILGDDLSLLARQRDAATNGLVLYAADHPGLEFRALLDGFNEQWVTASSFLSPELVVELLGVVGRWSDDFYGAVALDAVSVSGEPVGLFADTEPSPYWKIIAREYVERVVHQSQLRRALGAPELTGEPVTWAARVTAHLLAAWLPEYAAPPGSTIAVVFGDAGAWTWTRGADSWAVSEGRVDADAIVRFAPPSVVPALSRGVSANELTPRLEITGDEALARGALDLVAPLLARPQP